MTRATGLRSVVAAVAFALVAGACSTSTEPTATPAQGDGRVERVRVAARPGSYPTPIGARRQGQLQSTLLFDTLVWKDSTGDVIPWLASSWARSPDGTEITFTIRDGVRWHDGMPLTVDDVVFSYQYLMKPPGQAAAGILGAVFVGNLQEVVAVAPDQVVFRMKRPWAPFLPQIAGIVRIIPKHIWETVTDPIAFTGPQATIGSGPYKLESYDLATFSAALVANDDYFLGPPHVRRIEFVPAADQLLALQQGDIDAADAGTEDQLPENALAPFLQDPRFGSVGGPPEWNRALHFNLTKGFPFDDKRFRQAVAYAIDRDDMVKRILFGQGVVGSSGGLSPASPWIAPDLPPYAHDGAKADALLDQIGLKDADDDGVRDLPDGRPFVPELQTSAQFSPKTAELISEYLRQVGLSVTIRTLEAAAADDSAFAGTYEMTLLGYGALGGDPDLLLRVRHTPAAINLPQKSKGYDNPEVVALGEQQLFTADDSSRLATVQQLQRIVAEDLPSLSLYLPEPQLIFVKDVFDGWYLTPGGFGTVLSGALNKHALVTGKKVGF
ncbi:MAG: peptide/nickel transport system substrate-binding protein [Actinomycetota bacterium]|nr:peptide/nickel transport system substrate-binding protein [Actinomycetota bacterium]